MFLIFEIIMFNSKFRIKSYLSLSDDFFFFFGNGALCDTFITFEIKLTF